MSKKIEEVKKEVQTEFDKIHQLTKETPFLNKMIIGLATLSSFSSTLTIINDAENRNVALCNLATNLSLIYLVTQQKKSAKQKYETAVLGVHFNPFKDFNLSNALVRNQQTLQKVNWIKWGGAIITPTVCYLTGNLHFTPAFAAFMTGISATTIYRNKLLNDQRKIVEAGVPQAIIPHKTLNTHSRAD